MEVTTNSVINDVSELTFSDWQKIAKACENTETWGFFRWIENAKPERLQSASRAEIKAIGEQIGYGSGWVADKIDEHC
jgi:hypothetical protein